MVLRTGVFSEQFEGDLKNPDHSKALATLYRSALPCPHIVLNDVFSWEALSLLSGLFPKPDPSWWKYDNALERKFAKDDLDGVHVIFQHVVGVLQSKAFVSFLERISGIDNLIVDHRLRGGGLHQIARGGKLDMHKDFRYHPELRLKRRMNVIVYLNAGWRSEWRGALEFWNEDMSECVKKIPPTLGTVVIFNTDGRGYHGHPDPLECPEGETRKSLALYYYTSIVDSLPSDQHSTVYRARPQDAKDPATEALRQKRAKGRLH